MDHTISATEAARRFSEILNTVKFQGARYTIVRGGKPVASLGPVDASPVRFTLGDLTALFKRMPRLEEDEAAAFAEDLRWIAANQPPLPAPPAWD